MLFDKGSLTNLTKVGHMVFYSSKMIFIFNNGHYWKHYISVLILYVFCLSSRVQALEQNACLSHCCVPVFRLVSKAKEALGKYCWVEGFATIRYCVSLPSIF